MIPALDEVRVHVNLSLDDGLRILVQLGPGDIDQKGDWVGSPFVRVGVVRLHLIEIRSDDFDLLVLYLVGTLHRGQLKLMRYLGTTKLKIEVLLPDDFPFVLRSEIGIKL